MNGGKGPDVLGLCEVENAAVVKDLIRVLEPLKRSYRLIHKDSPSGRGIDCAILVDEARAKASDAEFHPVPGVKTRDIVEAKVAVDGKTLFVFMNHWPSRLSDNGGEQRQKAAKVLRKRVDEILHADAATDIVIGGDLDDHPTDKSVSSTMARCSRRWARSRLEPARPSTRVTGSPLAAGFDDPYPERRATESRGRTGRTAGTSISAGTRIICRWRA